MSDAMPTEATAAESNLMFPEWYRKNSANCTGNATIFPMAGILFIRKYP